MRLAKASAPEWWAARRWATLAPMDTRVALVTGAARGIGREIAVRLAEDGFDLAVADLREEAVAETAELVAAAGRRTLVSATDVSDEDAVVAMIERVSSELGGLDAVVNNAGILHLTPILDISAAEWDQTMAVNLRGTFLVSREAFRHMKERGAGKIVSIASLAAKVGGITAGAHYAASKAGVICFTKSLAAQAAAFSINVNAVAPGPVATEMTADWGDEVNEAFRARIPFGRYAEPRDVANAVAFLLSEQAGYITGEVIDVNGGSYMD